MKPAALLLAIGVVLGGCLILQDLSENLRSVGRQVGEALGLCCDAEKRVDRPPVRQQWQGLYPVVDLVVLPERGDQLGTGLIADPETWDLVWKAYRPREAVPAVDFSKEFIAFARNLTVAGKVELVHVAIGGNSLDLQWRMPKAGPAVGRSVHIAFAVLRRGSFGLVRSQGHALVLPPAKRPTAGGVGRKSLAFQPANPNIETLPFRKAP